MAPCVDGSSDHEHCVFDDVQCLLICELCGAVVFRDDSVFEVAFADGMPTSTRVHDEGSTSSDQVTANTVVRTMCVQPIDASWLLFHRALTVDTAGTGCADTTQASR